MDALYDVVAELAKNGNINNNLIDRLLREKQQKQMNRVSANLDGHVIDLDNPHLVKLSQLDSGVISYDSTTDTITVDGDIDATGDVAITGSLDATGDVAITGSLDVTGTVSWGGVNLIKNYPSLENADGVQPQWWENLACTTTEEDATGEGVSPAPNERIMKGVTTSAGGWMYQSFSPSNERLLNASSTKVSYGAWVYNAHGSGTLYFRLYNNNSGTRTLLGQAITGVLGEWVYLELDNITIGANTLECFIQHDQNAATFYAANIVLNVGPTVQQFRPRGLTYREYPVTIVDNVDPGGATTYSDMDMTFVSPNLVKVDIYVLYRNSTRTGVAIRLRRKGASDTTNFEVLRGTSTSVYDGNPATCLCDSDNIFQYASTALAGDTEQLYIRLRGYWEWE